MILERTGPLGDQSVKASNLRNLLGFHYLTIVR
jgi:hypothetical protein